MAFMAGYNIDYFRNYVEQHKLLDQFRLDKSRRRVIQTDDEALLQFSYDFLPQR